MSSLVPDVTYTNRRMDPVGSRPSWTANPGYLNDGHRSIYDETKDIPGWQMEDDAYKLYEMAYFAGDIILDLGAFGGRSAVVEVKGALSNPSRKAAPQVYSLDVERSAIHRSHESVKAFGVDQSVLFFLGGAATFFETFDVSPTMVFVDADHAYEGVRRDLDVLSKHLAPGVPVLCHDYLNRENDTGEYGVRKAADEWEEAGIVRFLGAFGCSAFFVTTDLCQGRARGLSDDAFAIRRDACLVAYGLQPKHPPRGAGDWHGRVSSLEQELASIRASRTYQVASALKALVRPVRRVVHRVAAGTARTRA